MDAAEALVEAGRMLSGKTEGALQSAITAMKTAVAALEELVASNNPQPQEPPLDKILYQEAAEPTTPATRLRESVAVPVPAGGPRKPALLKLITPGWGTSGYYSAEILRRDGPTAFPRGTFNYWNHATEAEERDRPEGDLNRAASVLVEDASFREDGPDGPGLYAAAKVFSDYADQVAEKGPHIGVSINAEGQTREGEAEGRTGIIIEKITRTPFSSADYVTVPGRGGKVLLQESARPSTTETKSMPPIEESEALALRESVNNLRAKLDEQGSTLAELTRENNELRKMQQLREAKDFVLGKLRDVQGLPEVLHEEMAEKLLYKGQVPVKDGQVNREQLEPLIEAEARRKMKQLVAMGIGDGNVRGNGGGGPKDDEEDPAKIKERLNARFQNIGMSEKAAEFAVAGRNGRKVVR